MNTWQLKTVWLGIALWCQASVSGQQFAYKQYDITDGLVGNHVYHAVQDKDGFMWFATETGLSRFDGTQFKNFNTEQGLPDNEIVRLFADSKGRVWIIPFKPTLSYYYQGKIYNARSDSVLKNLQLTEPVKAVVEDNYHNIILHCERILYILHPNGHISSVRQYDGAPIVISSIGCDALSRPYIMANVTDKGQSIFTCLRLHTYPRPALTIVAVQGQKELTHSIAEEHLGIFQRGIVMPMEQFLDKKPITQLHCWDMQSARKDTLLIPVGFNRLSFNSKGLVFINGSNGVNTYDFEHPGTTTNFLPGQNVSCTMDDTEGNRWFTTLGNGVFRLLSPEVKKIDLGINPFSVTALCKSGNRMVVAGDRDDRVYTVDFQTGTALQGHALPKGISNKVLGIVSEGGKLWFLLTWTFVAADSQCKSIRLVPAMIRHGLSYKDAVPLGNNRFLFATHISAMIIDGDQTGPSALQTVFAGRSTAVCVAYGDMYIGTLQGLYRIDTAQRSTYLGNGMPLLASRITKLLFAADRLWVGTNDNGVICYDGQKIIKKISVKTGLVGNIVRALHANGRYLWVGTDMGLNKIDMGDTSLPIVAQYTAADGLASDMVNAVYVSQNRVYVGTPAGLNFFDETKMSNQSHCNLQIVSITVSGRERSLDAGRLYLHN